jgi:hypothetical protein
VQDVSLRASLGRAGRQSKLVLYSSQGHRLLYGTVSTSCPSEAAYHELFFKTIRPPSCRAPYRGTGGMTWPRAFARSDPGGTPSSSTYHVLPHKDTLVDRSTLRPSGLPSRRVPKLSLMGRSGVIRRQSCPLDAPVPLGKKGKEW